MPDGIMRWFIDTRKKLSGYESFNVISFVYEIPGGVKSDGSRYSGTSRTAFLPMDCEGTVIFKMLVEAFKRRLTFLVGTSLTTG